MAQLGSQWAAYPPAEIGRQLHGRSMALDFVTARHENVQRSVPTNAAVFTHSSALPVSRLRRRLTSGLKLSDVPPHLR